MTMPDAPTLSTGQASTLGVWRDLTVSVFGAHSAQAQYFEKKIEEQGELEPVLADESQVLLMLASMDDDDANA